MNIKNNNQPRILLVEDEVIVQVVHRTMLEKMGCNVVIAACGKEAIEKYSQGNFDLIFMDIGLPDMRGTEAAAKIRKYESNVHIPIIAITAYIAEEIDEECMKAGIDKIYNKPIQATVLKQILRDAHINVT